MRALVTGGAGFIGSNLVDRLVANGDEVVIYDNLSTGRREFVAPPLGRPGVRFEHADVLDQERLTEALGGCDTVFHLAANADVRHGLEHPQYDLEQNTVATSSVLEAMRAAGVLRIAFASTGSVYGEPAVFPTPEDCPFPTQTSLYGASKLASEGLISAYCHGFGFTAAVFRFVSILGERYTHGHVVDFFRSLRRDPSRLRVLGNGRQEKSYLYVGDCIAGILAGLGACDGPACTVFNLGTDETIVVDESISIIASHMGVQPTIEHTGGARGWAGDSPLIHLDCSRIRALDWQPSMTIRQAIVATLRWLEASPYAIEEAALR